MRCCLILLILSAIALPAIAETSDRPQSPIPGGDRREVVSYEPPPKDNGSPERTGDAGSE